MQAAWFCVINSKNFGPVIFSRKSNGSYNDGMQFQLSVLISPTAAVEFLSLNMDHWRHLK